MTTLLVPELQRYLTRRVTWIGGIAVVGLLATVTFLVGIRNMTSYGDSTELSSLGPGMILLPTALLGAWSYFTAASAIGSEQSSGALGTWLTFNPRRWRVFGAKLLAVALPSALLAAAALIVTTGWALLLSDRAHPTALTWMLGAVVRGVLVVASCAVLGFVIALATGSTLGALGVLVGWLVLIALQAFFAEVTHAYWTWFGLERVVFEFLMSNDWRYFGELHIDPVLVGGAGVIWFGFVGAVAIASGYLFARRDID